MDERTNPLPAPTYDVVVVGARAAGASTAMLLARRGLSVLAVDRTAYGSDTMSTHSLARAGVLQLSRWGLLDAVRAAGTPVATRVDFRYGDDDVVIDVPPAGDVDGLYSPKRTVLDRILVDAAVAAGADVRHGVTMVGLVRDGHGCVTGVQLDVDGALATVGARHVVGADGMRSKVAKHVRARTTYRAPTGAASIYTYVRGLPSDTIVNRYRPGGVVGIIPCNDGDAVVWAGTSAERFRAEGRGNVAELHATLLACAPDIADQVREGERVAGFRAFPGLPGFVRDCHGPGWSLVGDAAYFKDPVSAHGITDALIGAELVAEAVAGVLLGGDDERSALSAYAEVRDEMASAMMPPVAAAAALPRDMVAVREAFRGMSLAMRAEWAMIEQRWCAAVPA